MTDFSIILQRHTAVPQHSMVILISCKRLYARNKTNSHLNIPTHTYNTRSQSSFINPCSKGNIYVNSFFPRTIKDWNALALNIRKIETLEIFKCTVQEQILITWLHNSIYLFDYLIYLFLLFLYSFFISVSLSFFFIIYLGAMGNLCQV